MRINIGLSEGQRPETIVHVVGAAKGGGIGYQHETPEKIIIGIGNTAFKQELERRIAMTTDATSLCIASWAMNSPGSLIVINRCDGSVFISIDLLGCFPLFLRRIGDRIWLSDQVSELLNGKEDIDPAAVTAYLRFGFCVGAKTLFKQVRRLRPGEFASISLNHDEEIFEDRSRLWTLSSSAESRDDLLELFCETLKSATQSREPCRLMMSGGWDSRLLLAAALASGESTQPSLYFHGDIESRESHLVRQIQADEGLEAKFIEIRPEIFCPDQLAVWFRHFESVSFPFWHVVREQAPSDSGIIMAGIFGEVVGGHYGPPMVLSGQDKILKSLAWLLAPRFAGRGQSKAEGLMRAKKIFRQIPYTLPWYMKEEVWLDTFQGIHESVEEDIGIALDRYEKRGITAAHTLIEAYITEHRGSQPIAAQLHSAAGTGGFSAPYADRQLIEIAASLPFQIKIFNRFTQAAIHRLWPSLLNYPIAATLCNAKRPIPVLEASRGARKIVEAFWKRFAKIYNPARSSAPRLSWVNFTDVAKSGVLNNVVSSLIHPSWDKPRMYATIKSVSSDQTHPLTDMLMKIKTLDLFLTSHHENYPTNRLPYDITKLQSGSRQTGLS